MRLFVRCLLVRLSVCLSVCLSVQSHNSVRPNFTNILHVACVVARSSCDGVAVSHLFPVLWMTSCFHIMYISKRRQNTIIGLYQYFNPDGGETIAHRRCQLDKGKPCKCCIDLVLSIVQPTIATGTVRQTGKLIDRRTDGRTNGRITTSLNATYSLGLRRRGHNITQQSTNVCDIVCSFRCELQQSSSDFDLILFSPEIFYRQ